MVKVFPIYHHGRRINVPNVLGGRVAETNFVMSGAFNYLNCQQETAEKMDSRIRDMKIIARRKQLEGGLNSEYTFG